jgi:hypothetical protein
MIGSITTPGIIEDVARVDVVECMVGFGGIHRET